MSRSGRVSAPRPQGDDQGFVPGERPAALDGARPVPAGAQTPLSQAHIRILLAQGAVRAMIAATITRPELAATRPGIRFGLIDEALSPLSDTLGTTDPAGFAQLKNDLAAVVSAEAFFVLSDLAGLTPDDAIASLVRTATALEQPWPAAV